MDNINKKHSPPLASVIVLSCPGRKVELFRCLNSIKDSNYKNIEVILVLNSYDNNFIKEIRCRFENVKIILLPKNTGCFGFNVGYANAIGKYLLSLDDDTSIMPDTITKIAKIFEEKPKEVAILSLNVYNPRNKKYYVSPPASNDFISFQAGGVVFRKELFDKVGYFDEDFFLWGEEDDFTLRVLNAGLRIDFEKNILIYHYETSKKLREIPIFLNARNKAWLNIKHFSLIFIPFLVLRDLAWIFLLPYRKKSLKALYYGAKGYVCGYLNFFTPLRKRRVVFKNIQTLFIKHYLLSDLMRTIKK